MKSFISRNRGRILIAVFAAGLVAGIVNAEPVDDYNLVIETCNALTRDECDHGRNLDNGVNLITSIPSLANRFCEVSLAVPGFDFNSINGEVCK